MDYTVLPAITLITAFTSQAITRWRLHRLEWRTSNCSLLLIYLPRKDERLSWLTCSGRFTHMNGHPSAGGWARRKKSSLVKKQRSTTEG